MTAQNMNLFEYPEQNPRKKRMNYVKSKSKDGELTVHIAADVARMLKRFCKVKNTNCKQVVNDLLREKLKEMDAAKYDGMSREELLALVKRMERDDDKY